MKKILIAGTRTFTNYKLLKSIVDAALINQTEVEIVSGGCRGADKLGERFANEHSAINRITRFPADWEKHGKAAGPLRNAQMAEYCDFFIIFYDGRSRGTYDMLKQLDMKNKSGLVYNYVTGKDVEIGEQI